MVHWCNFTTFGHLHVLCVLRVSKSGIEDLLNCWLTAASEKEYVADERMR